MSVPLCIRLNVCFSPLQVQTVLKKVPVAAPNQTEPIIVNKKSLEYKWGMNVLGELTTEVTFALHHELCHFAQ